MLFPLFVLYSLTSLSLTIDLGEIFTNADNINGVTYGHFQNLFADVNVLKQQMANLASSNALLQNSVATLQVQLIGSSDIISQLEGKITALESTNTILQSNLDTMQNTDNTQQTQLMNQTNTIQLLEKANAVLQSTVSTIQTQLINSTNSIELSQYEVATLKSNMVMLQSIIAVAEDKTAALESEVATPTLKWIGQTTGDHDVISGLPPSVRSGYAAATNNTNYYTTTITSSGIYLVIAQGRLSDWSYREDSWWSMRVYNKNRGTTLFASFGTHRHSYDGTNTMDASTSGFWIGKLNEGDVLEQQYHLPSLSTEGTIFFQDVYGSSAIYAIKIGK
jgi:predicted  nucleic acid-binding Zn-ribbon protein